MEADIPAALHGPRREHGYEHPYGEAAGGGRRRQATHTPHTGHIVFAVLAVFLDVIADTVAIRVCFCFSATKRTVHCFPKVFEALCVAIGDQVDIRTCFYFSKALFACQSLCTVLGVFIVAVRNIVAVRVCLSFSVPTTTGNLFVNTL